MKSQQSTEGVSSHYSLLQNFVIHRMREVSALQSWLYGVR